MSHGYVCPKCNNEGHVPVFVDGEISSLPEVYCNCPAAAKLQTENGLMADDEDDEPPF